MREHDLGAARLLLQHAAKPLRPLGIAHRPVLVVARTGVHEHQPPVRDVLDVLVAGAPPLGLCRSAAPTAAAGSGSRSARSRPGSDPGTARWRACPSRDCRRSRTRRPCCRRTARRRARTPLPCPSCRRRRRRRSASGDCVRIQRTRTGGVLRSVPPPSANQKMLATTPPPFAAPVWNSWRRPWRGCAPPAAALQ